MKIFITKKDGFHVRAKGFRGLLYLPIFLVTLGMLSGKPAEPETIVWHLDNLKQVGDCMPAVLGDPAVFEDAAGKSICFDGIDDGLVLSKIPVEGWQKFTIQVLFKPAGDGPVAPRFIHFEDKDLNRGTFEARLTPDGKWYMDTFLKNGSPGNANRGLALIDSTKLHAADRWFWVAMVYDGKTMSSYVNGKKELQGEIDMPPFTAGNISLGVRLNKVSWFKGCIKEIRFHPVVLAEPALEKMGE